MQTTVLTVTIIGIFLITAVFAFVLRSSRERSDDYGAISLKAYAIRLWWFITLSVLGSVVTVATLTPFPLAAEKTAETKIVKAVSGQWYWTLDDTTATVGKPVQYQVSTVDVNHGFAIFNPDNQIIAQTQAMPGYTNNLNITFKEPGTHIVRCLEYCGLAHHAMIIEILVSEAK